MGAQPTPIGNQRSSSMPGFGLRQVTLKKKAFAEDCLRMRPGGVIIMSDSMFVSELATALLGAIPANILYLPSIPRWLSHIPGERRPCLIYWGESPRFFTSFASVMRRQDPQRREAE